ncbi:MAG TPA: DUF6602 domain-containing protein, partial [Gemmatimonadaceae bacterium]|nr:DUF6602 domain-containing protein [Gemmatimonadaceae bacterium]
IDADGERSQQIDIVIHDRQYCPLLLDTEGGIHVPAESVYAVIEVKQDLSKRWVEYAGEKIESVRRLRRTSATYGTNVGQQQTQPKDILGGLVAYHSGWSPPFGDPFHEVLASLPAQRRLDFGCALTNGGFDIEYRGNDVQLITSEAAGSVIFFFFRLLKRLQQFGTVPAIKYDEYSNLLVDEEAHAPMRTTRTATGS